MSTARKIFYLIITLFLLVAFPYIGAYWHFEGNFPEDYFNFPPLEISGEKAPFSLFMFVSIAMIFGTVILLYIFPGIFGFKKPENAVKKEKIKKTSFPIWFWIGLLMWGITLFLLWGKYAQPKIIINWAALPLFWGFSMVLDGIVYVRRGGKSIIGTAPRELVAIGVASISGWLIFEFLNFFVNDNWIYPFGDLIPEDEFVIYAVLGSSGLMPMVFEWYSLFNSFPGFRNKYANGPKINSNKAIDIFLFIAFLAGMFFAPIYPDQLFSILWVGPLVIFTILLEYLKIWTPFNSIKNGNWTPLLFIALAFLVQGFLTEFWNYFSAFHENGIAFASNNPDFWSYSIPYVNVLHVFEMPLLGFLGYLPYGIYTGIWWIIFAYLLNINSRYNEAEESSI